MLLTIFFYSKYLKNSQDADHDKSIFVSVMTIHEFGDLATEVHDEYEKDKYRHHESLSILTYPVRERTMIRFEIFCLQHCESSYYEYEQYCEYARLWNPVDSIDGYRLTESLLEHIESSKEDDKKSNPLDTWIPF